MQLSQSVLKTSTTQEEPAHSSQRPRHQNSDQPHRHASLRSGVCEEWKEAGRDGKKGSGYVSWFHQYAANYDVEWPGATTGVGKAWNTSFERPPCWREPSGSRRDGRADV